MMPTRRERPAPETAPHRRLITYLTRRRPIRQTLTIVLVAALAPLAILAAARGIYGIRADQVAAANAVARAAQHAQGAGGLPIRDVQAALDLLALNPERLGPGCDGLLSSAAGLLATPARLARIGPDGLVACASDSALNGKPLPQGPLADGYPLLLRSHADERLAALVDPDNLTSGLALAQPDAGGLALLVDGNGRLVAGPAPGHWVSVPTETLDGSVVAFRDATGRNWLLATAPLTLRGSPDARLNLLFAHRRAGLSGHDWWYYASSFALPLLALVLASLAIWAGASHSILRWVEELRRVTGDIGEGNYRVPAERFDDAPLEVRDLAADVQRMARTIAERDRNLTDSLDQQKSLALELHHRVGNNLQLISSYIGLQADGQRVDEHAVQGPLELVRLRVSTLSLVHGLLYRDAGRADVTAAMLLSELALLVRREWGGEAVPTAADDLAVGIDGAVAIALAVIEAESWVRAPEQAGLALTLVSLKASGDRVLLGLALTGEEPVRLRIDQPPRLMHAFARQLGGTLDAGWSVESGGRLNIDFPSINLNRGFQPSVGNKSRA
ncbi:MAG: hypothetical protein DI568_14320 [Sphingomonas sp.]|nr:MAG: hypothetical protein DI568_14320 [Sphingomonas sp.]